MTASSRVHVFGSGSVAQALVTERERFNLEILSFLDNAPARQGGEFCGLPVRSPEAGVKEPFDYIVIASSFHAEIRGQLRGMGAADERILIYPGYNLPNGIYSRFPDALDRHRFELLVLPITHKCGLKCTHCPKDRNVYYPEWMLPLPEYLRFLARFESGSFKSLNVSGSGDPFILKETSDYLRAIRAAGWESVSSFTSAAVTHRRLLEEIVAEGLLNRITISLEAGSEAAFKAVRGFSFGHVERFLGCVNEFRAKYASPLELAFSFTYGKMNLDEFVPVVEAARRFGVGEVCASALVASYSEERAPEGKVCTPRNVIGDFSEPGVQAAIGSGRALAEAHGITLKVRQELARHNCSDPYEVVRVDRNGDVYPCCAGITMPHPMGNLREHTFREIWSGEGYRTLLHDLANLEDPEANAYCRACWWFKGDYTANVDYYYVYPYDL